MIEGQSIVHIGMSLDMAYIQGATALINSIIKNASCPQHLFFHFMIATANARGAARESGSGSGFPDAKSVIAYYFPFLDYHMYEVDDHTLKKTVRLVSSCCIMWFLLCRGRRRPTWLSSDRLRAWALVRCHGW